VSGIRHQVVSSSVVVCSAVREDIIPSRGKLLLQQYFITLPSPPLGPYTRPPADSYLLQPTTDGDSRLRNDNKVAPTPGQQAQKKGGGRKLDKWGGAVHRREQW
ncbi:unnamed protein product, partial [Meganyctiphanes norvegica]